MKLKEKTKEEIKNYELGHEISKALNHSKVQEKIDEILALGKVVCKDGSLTKKSQPYFNSLKKILEVLTGYEVYFYTQRSNGVEAIVGVNFRSNKGIIFRTSILSVNIKTGKSEKIPNDYYLKFTPEFMKEQIRILKQILKLVEGLDFSFKTMLKYYEL